MKRKKQTIHTALRALPWSISASIGMIGATLIYGVARITDASSDVQRTSVWWYLHTMHAGYLLRVLAAMVLGVCFLAAFRSASEDRRRGKLLDGQQDIASIKRLSWQDFELLVSEAYRRVGFAVEEVGQGGADGGVDLILSRKGSKTLVQCKRWNTSSVGAPIVREMFGLMHHHGAADVKIVCASGFTKEAQRFAIDKPIELVDGTDLLKLVGLVRRGHLEGDSAMCYCGALMKRRGKGTQQFMGCTRYPDCKVTRPLE